MKKYIVFGYDQFYPLGGMMDFQDDFDTLEEALVYVKKDKWVYYDVVNRDTWEDVEYD